MTKLPVSQSVGDRLAEFMRQIAGQTYPEPLTEMHSDITKRVLKEFLPKLPIKARVLDVGCGQGPALAIFAANGIEAIGIALNDEDVRKCAAEGFIVLKMDQNDLQFPDDSFECVWARHVLEHSIAPLWTLAEFHRVLEPGGWLYVEVPAPDTDCRHETNKNHYSVLGRNAWYELLIKSGFHVLEEKTMSFLTLAGPDVYFSFTCRKLEPIGNAA